MRAVRLNEIGGPERLHVEDVAEPVAAQGQVLVRVHRAAFNRRDVFISQGLYPGVALPLTPGSDGAGEVAKLGSGVTTCAAGDAVVIDPELGWDEAPGAKQRHGNILGMPSDGTFAEYVVVPAPAVYPKPASLSMDEAAALPLAGLTAYRAVFTRGKVTKDDVVLITGVGSGVQTFVLLFAKYAGARTIVTTGSPEKVARAKALGADVAIDYRADPEWHKTVRKAADGIGPSLIVDSTGGETLARSLDIARLGARVVVYGATQGDAKIRPFSLFWKHLDLLGTSMGSPADFAAMLALFDTGLKPVVDRIYPMTDVAEAARRVLDGEQFGKVLLAID